MKSVLIILTVACVLTAAMVPRQRRALNSDKDIRPEPTTSVKPPEVCARQTPCAWSVYRPQVKIIEQTIINTYCDCAPGYVCEVNEDDSVANAFVHRCRVPREDGQS